MKKANVLSQLTRITASGGISFRNGRHGNDEGDEKPETRTNLDVQKKKKPPQF